MSRSRAIRRRWLAAIGALGLLAGAGELGLRLLLFHPSALARRLGGPFRRPELYADPLSEDAYWKLRYVFEELPGRPAFAAVTDPVCGWIGDVDASAAPPAVAADLRGRRPVLLFGDSLAACGAPPSLCFEGILERSPLSDRYRLTNYAVAGYGIDQEFLLCKKTIDAWKQLDPIVVLGVPAGDALCRSLLAFVEAPKPRLSIDGGRLAVEPPSDLDSSAFVLRHPIGIRSYLGRLLLRPFAGDGAARERAGSMAARILEEMHAELSARKITHFVLVFDGSSASDWAGGLLDATAARLSVPILHTRAYLSQAAGAGSQAAGAGSQAAGAGSQAAGPEARAAGTAREVLRPDGRFEAAYTELGDRLAFEALRRGIEGSFGTEDLSGVPAILRSGGPDPGWRVADRILGCPTWCAGSGPATAVRFSRTPYPPFDANNREEYLILRPGSSEPLRVRLTPREGRVRLSGSATAVAPRASTETVELVLSVRLDERLALRSKVPPWPASVDVDVELGGARELEISAERAGSSAGTAWIHLARPRLE